MYVDVHVHLLKQFYSDDELQAIMQEAQEQGMKAIIVNGLNPATNREILALAEQYPLVKPALGFYPLDALQQPTVVEEEIAFLERQRERIFAIGEVGMDFKYSDEKKAQEEHFLAFIQLSERLKKPLIVHSRKAEKEVVELLTTSSNKKIVMHSFSGNFKLVKQIEDYGWYFSIPTSIAYATHFQEMAKRVNINQLFTETDAPFLAPVKQEKNKPTNVIKSVQTIASLKCMDEEEVKLNIFMNYQKVFL